MVSAVRTPVRRGVSVWDRTAHLRDALFVAVVIASSSASYAPKLGFSADDWAFLGSLSTHGDLSSSGRSTNLVEPMQSRPVMAAYLTLLYDAFGTYPFGYHVVNTVVLALMCAFGYLALRELGTPRAAAVAVAIVYGLLPHYSTDRFWWAASCYGVSMTLAFASLYADLQALRKRGLALWYWKLVALLALTMSGLGIEIALPLLAAMIPLLWYRARRLADVPAAGRMTLAGATAFVAANAAILVCIGVFKAASAPGVGVPGTYGYHLARLALGSTATAFGSYGVGLPDATRWAIATVGGATVLAGIGLASAVGLYLAALATRDTSSGWTMTTWMRLMLAGLLVFVLGYAIFLTNARVLFTSTGIANRVAIAAAAGVAMIWVGLAGAICTAIPLPWRPRVFATAVAGLSLSGFLIVQALALTWVEAWQRQQAVLADIRASLPVLEPDTTVILDGTCSYVGPAIVFESNWDLAGALNTLYHEPTVRADVTSAGFDVGDEGVSTRLYGGLTAHYPYGPRLLVFDARGKHVRRLTNATDARTWWSAREQPDCPRGAAGYGTTLFGWDRRYRRLENTYLWR